MITKAFVLALLAAICPDAQRVAEASVVNAIVKVSSEASHEEVALLTLYAWLESNAREHPKAYSWDARAGVSCGPWQEPCAFVSKASVEEQARYWLRELRASGLASLDSSPKRAEARRTRALAALARASE